MGEYPFLSTGDGDPPCLLGLETIFRDGVPVGVTRRGEHAFYLDKPIAFG